MYALLYDTSPKYQLDNTCHHHLRGVAATAVDAPIWSLDLPSIIGPLPALSTPPRSSQSSPSSLPTVWSPSASPPFS